MNLTYFFPIGTCREEALIIRDLDLEMIDEVRNQWAFYRDRRPSTYEDLVAP